MVKVKDFVLRKINAALKGDTHAIAYLEITDSEVSCTVQRDITWEQLQRDYHNTAVQFEAAGFLGIFSAQHAAKTGLINYARIAKEKFGKEIPVAASKVLQDEILQQVKQLMEEVSPMLEETEYEDRDSDVSFSQVQDSNNEKDDSVSDDNEPQSLESKKPKVDKGKEDQETEADESSTTSEDEQACRKKFKTAQGKDTKKEQKQTPRKRLHHKFAKCRVGDCQYYGVNLKRHLQVHVKKGEITQAEIPRLTAIMVQGAKKRGPRKSDANKEVTRRGRIKKWCPVADCNSVTTYISKHLRGVHKMKKGSKELEVMLRAAKPYSGLDELEPDTSSSEAEIEVDTSAEKIPAEAMEVESTSTKSDESADAVSSSHKTAKSADESSCKAAKSADASSWKTAKSATASSSKTAQSGDASSSSCKTAKSADASSSKRAKSADASSSKRDKSADASSSCRKTPQSADTPSGKTAKPAALSSSSEEQSDDDEAYKQETAEHSSSSSDESSSPSIKAYLNARRYRDSRHKWLCGFYNYLSLPDAGFKKESTRMQHARQIAMLLDFLDPDGGDITSIAADNGDAVWIRWVQPALKNKSKAPGTIISYLTSLEKFLTYVTSTKYDVRLMPPLHSTFKQAFADLIPALKGWRSTVDNATQSQQLQRHIDEADELLTPEDIQRLKQSRPYTEGIKLIIQAGQGKRLNVREFAEARDLLLGRLTLATGTRPGALNNATVNDYEKAKSEKGKRIMLVAKHKRSKDGPAILGMDAELQKLMSIYVREIRPSVAQPEEDKLFVKDDGKGFPENTIGKRLSSFWQKSGVRAGKRVSHTAYRKFVATSTHEKAPGEAETVQKVLGHSKKSFERSYVRSQCTTTGSKGMDVIAAVTSVDTLHSELNAAEQQQEADEEREMAAEENTVEQEADEEQDMAAEENTVDDNEIMPPTPPALTQHKTVPVADTSEAEEPDPKVASPVDPPPAASQTTLDKPPSPQKKGKSPPAASQSSSNKPPPLQEKQKRPSRVDSPPGATQKSPEKLSPLEERHKIAIKELFHEEIEKRQSPELKVVRNRMCTRTVLRRFALNKRRVKQVQNYLSYVIKSEPEQFLSDDDTLPPEKKVKDWFESFDDDTSSMTSGRRQYWDPNDTKIIVKHFIKLKQLPSKDTMRQIFRSQDDLYQIMQQEGFRRCYEKVKTEWKKKKKS